MVETIQKPKFSFEERRAYERIREQLPPSLRSKIDPFVPEPEAELPRLSAETWSHPMIVRRLLDPNALDSLAALPPIMLSGPDGKPCIHKMPGLVAFPSPEQWKAWQDAHAENLEKQFERERIHLASGLRGERADAHLERIRPQWMAERTPIVEVPEAERFNPRSVAAAAGVGRRERASQFAKDLVFGVPVPMVFVGEVNEGFLRGVGDPLLLACWYVFEQFAASAWMASPIAVVDENGETPVQTPASFLLRGIGREIASERKIADPESAGWGDLVSFAKSKLLKKTNGGSQHVHR